MRSTAENWRTRLGHPQPHLSLREFAGFNLVAGRRRFASKHQGGCARKIIMIIDVHSHAWKFPEHFTEDFAQQARRARAGMEVDLTIRYEDYRAAAPADTKTVVFGGKAKLSGTWVDDRHVADYVAAHPDTLIGFLALDPTQAGWEREMEFGHQELGLRGIKLLPMYAGFRP